MVRSFEDQQKSEMAKEQAIAREGKKFITLRLLDENKNHIQGAIVLHASPYLDLNNNQKFHFKEQGGPLDFKEDEFKGGEYCRMYDCQYNRHFLASHFNSGIWEIEDERVRAEIAVMAEAIKDKAILKESPKTADPAVSMTDEDLSMNLAKLQKEQAERVMLKGGAPRMPKLSQTQPAAPTEEMLDTPETPEATDEVLPGDPQFDMTQKPEATQEPPPPTTPYPEAQGGQAAPTAPEAPKPELTRGQKAVATRRANAAKKAGLVEVG
jgi:hypothetical protein